MIFLIAKFGMLICFDYLFPELWRNLALKSADIVFHPSNLVTPFGQRVVPTHCIVNSIFAVTANRTGTEGSLSFSGQSIICNPKGDILADGHKNIEEIIYAKIDPEMARDKMITPKNHVLKDRRPNLYI